LEQRPEHRRCPRYTLRVPVRFRVLDLEFGMSEQVVESANISRNGVYLTSPLALPVGKKIYMKLCIPVDVCGLEDAESSGVGRIVRNEMLDEGGTGYGVEIDRVRSIKTLTKIRSPR
jgi:PilZ domain